MEVIYEDNHIIIVNKAVGEIVQGDRTGDIPLVETVRQYKKNTQNPAMFSAESCTGLTVRWADLLFLQKPPKPLPGLMKCFAKAR